MMIGFSLYVHADELRVAVIDTGLDITDPRLSTHICKDGNQDFTKTDLKDNIGHGTHVVGLIEQYAKNSNYCLVILKYYNVPGLTLFNYVTALKEAVAQNVDIVNFSSTGPEPDEEERNLICDNPKITFVVAAGNEGVDISKEPRWPASYGCSNIITVAAKDYRNSNYGPTYLVQVLEKGLNINSTLPNGKEGEMTGTSMSTAITTGKLIYEKSHKSSHSINN